MIRFISMDAFDSYHCDIEKESFLTRIVGTCTAVAKVTAVA